MSVLSIHSWNPEPEIEYHILSIFLNRKAKNPASAGANTKADQLTLEYSIALMES